MALPNPSSEIQWTRAAEVASDIRTGFKTVGDCPNFAQSAEQNGTVPLSETVLKPVLVQVLLAWQRMKRDHFIRPASTPKTTLRAIIVKIGPVCQVPRNAELRGVLPLTGVDEPARTTLTLRGRFPTLGPP